MTTASPSLNGCSPFAAQSRAPPSRQPEPGNTPDRLAGSRLCWSAQPAPSPHCRLCLDAARHAENCSFMRDCRKPQKLLAAGEMSFQKNGTATAKGQPSTQYGRTGNCECDTVPESFTRKLTRAFASPINIEKSHPVLMQDARLETMEPIPESEEEREYA